MYIARFYKKNKNHIYKGVVEYVANACGSWFLMKGAPLGDDLFFHKEHTHALKEGIEKNPFK